jgi:hypothetical protein
VNAPGFFCVRVLRGGVEQTDRTAEAGSYCDAAFVPYFMDNRRWRSTEGAAGASVRRVGSAATSGCSSAAVCGRGERRNAPE